MICYYYSNSLPALFLLCILDDLFIFLIKWVNPRLCRGDSQSLTITGKKESLRNVNRPKLT